jgi:SAM-dependent methyltransferase
LAVKESAVQILRCPRCKHDRSLELEAAVSDEQEVREGTLRCRNCGQAYSVSEGIIDLLYEPPEFVRREAAGLDRFAEVMRNDGWGREKILALPNVELGYWYAQATAMEALLASVDLRPGQRLVDVGSNTCWASNIFAERGLDVVALDIAKTELQGLRTAEYFIGSGNLYFERLQSVMFDMALASETMDYVFCCEVLHHNDAGNLRRTMQEAFRVLRPGGSLLVINEPLRFLFNLKRDHAHEVAQYEGYEHVFFFHQYYLAARRAGFQVRIREPAPDPFFRPWAATLAPETPIRDAIRSAGAHVVRRHPLTRRLMLAYKTLLVGDTSLHMIATKPGASGSGGANSPLGGEASDHRGGELLGAGSEHRPERPHQPVGE